MYRFLKTNIFFIPFVLSQIYLNQTQYRSDDLEGRIVGGIPVEVDQYPFAVQFFNLGALCGGVIVNSWTILTSAHCFGNNHDISDMRIQIGSKYIYDFNAKRYKVSKFVIHENYSKEIQFQYDIALVFIKQQLKLGNISKKAILVNTDKWMNKNETRFIVTGWGWTTYGGPVSKLGLLMTYLTYVPLEECSELHQIKLTEDMFCLYGHGARDTCKGDSGGGVLWQGMIVGLTSHGDGCAKKNKPSVYTNLWHLRDWIRKQVFQYMDYYCTKKKRHHLG